MSKAIPSFSTRMVLQNWANSSFLLISATTSFRLSIFRICSGFRVARSCSLSASILLSFLLRFLIRLYIMLKIGLDVRSSSVIRGSYFEGTCFLFLPINKFKLQLQINAKLCFRYLLYINQQIIQQFWFIQFNYCFSSIFSSIIWSYYTEGTFSSLFGLL